MMTKIKHLAGLVLLAFLTTPTTMTAQDKLFTLEDLNFSGTNFHNMQPKNIWLTWWGDQLIQTDVEECYTIDARTGKKEKLFTLEEINQWAGSDDERYVRHLMNASFPYPDRPLVQVGNRRAVILVDFKQKKIVWQDSIAGQTANDWNAISKATAYVEGHQLFVVDANEQKHQLSTDGSREIVYGQSVHRNEFGLIPGQELDGMQGFYVFVGGLAIEFRQLLTCRGVIRYQTTVVLSAIQFEHIDGLAVRTPRDIGEITVCRITGL